MKKELVEEIKNLLRINNESIEINEKYLDYFEQEELLNIKEELELKKINSSHFSNQFLDEIYNKTKKNNV